MCSICSKRATVSLDESSVYMRASYILCVYNYILPYSICSKRAKVGLDIVVCSSIHIVEYRALWSTGPWAGCAYILVHIVDFTSIYSGIQSRSG